MRKKGMSYLGISNAINATHDLGGEKLTFVNVQRYCKNHVNDNDEYSSAKGDNVNVYNENLDILNTINSNIEMFNMYLDSVSNAIQSDELTQDEMFKLFSYSKELQLGLDKFISRKQEIVKEIFSLQKEVYNMKVVNELLLEVLDCVKKNNMKVYNNVVEKLRNNQKFIECIKKIQ